MAVDEHVLAGKILHHRSNREANAEALRARARAIALDPSCGLDGMRERAGLAVRLVHG